MSTMSRLGLGQRGVYFGLGLAFGLGFALHGAAAGAAPRPSIASCGVGLAGTTYLLRLTGPRKLALAHCAADVKHAQPIGGYWSTRTGAGLALLCQARYRDGLLAQIYAASSDDFYGNLGCSLQADDVHTGRAHALPVHKR